jgi:hypothetical protein
VLASVAAGPFAESEEVDDHRAGVAERGVQGAVRAQLTTPSLSLILLAVPAPTIHRRCRTVGSPPKYQARRVTTGAGCEPPQTRRLSRRSDQQCRATVDSKVAIMVCALFHSVGSRTVRPEEAVP